MSRAGYPVQRLPQRARVPNVNRRPLNTHIG